MKKRKLRRLQFFSIRYLRIGRLLRCQAGIAQLVEQATENRRVPSSNLGPGTIMKAPKGAFLMPKTPYMVLLEHISFNKAQKHISLNRYGSGMAAVS